MIAIFLLALQLDVCAPYKDFKPPVHECKEDPEVYCFVHLAEKAANEKRDYRLAEYFLCEAGKGELAEAEFESMWKYLQDLRAGKVPGDLDFCEHTTSGYAATYCANVHWDKMMPQYDARLEKAGIPAALRNAGNTYVRKESDRVSAFSIGGTGYTAIMLDAEVEEKKRFVENVELYAKERAPSASAADLEKADEELNAAYRAARAQLDSDDEVMADWPKNLRDAQRAWIAYRDAFAKWYVTKWKGKASGDALRREIFTALTRARSAELQPEE